MASTKSSAKGASKAGGSTRAAGGSSKAVDPNLFTVERIFPEERLDKFNTSKIVRSLSPSDFEDMARAFSVPPQRITNKKIAALTSADLLTIDGLFADYRYEVIANFQGVGKLTAAHTVHNVAASGSSCCCCCTPCCSCCSAAVQVDPMGDESAFA